MRSGFKHGLNVNWLNVDFVECVGKSTQMYYCADMLLYYMFQTWVEC